MFLHACLRVVRLWRMGCLVLCGFFLCFGGGAAAFAAPSVEEMAGQMLLVGFKGQEPEECGAILGDIQTRHLGGVILFKRDARNAKLPRNIRDAAQVKRLTAALRGASAFCRRGSGRRQGGPLPAGRRFSGVPFGRGAGPGHARCHAPHGPRHGPHVAGARGQSQFRPRTGCECVSRFPGHRPSRTQFFG